MVAVKTGLTTPPPMPGMPAPMQPMGGLPPMPPMGGPGTFPVPQGGNPFAPLPPMPLAGSPPPMGGPGTFPVAPNRQVAPQQGSNAPRRKRFGDSLEGMLGRNMFAPQQQRSLPIPQQQRMVAPGTPMMRTPPMGRGMPRPMREGGIVQYMSGGGVDAATANAYIQNMVAGRSDLTAAEKLEFANSLASSMGVQGGSGVQSAIDNLAGLEVSPVAQNNNASASVAESYDNYPDNYNYLGGNTYDADANTYTTADGTVISPVENAVNQTGYMNDADLVTLGGMQKYNDDATVAAVMNQLSDSGSLDNFLALNEAAGTDLTNVNTVLSGMNTNTTTTNNGTTGTTGANNFMRTEVIKPSSLGNVALFGPNVTDTASYSQFVQDPKTFKVTAPDGDTMTAVSPIGAIDLPAAPIDLNIGNYLADPVYGSMDTPIEKNMGGVVPMQTNIAGQPHGLAYINQDEEALLRSFGGSGIMGPGGIPSYPPTGVTSGGGSGASTSFDSGYKPITTNYTGGKDDDDDKPSSSDKMSFGDDDYTPTSAELNQQLADQGLTNVTSDTSNVNFGTTSSGKDFTTAAQADTDVSGAEFVALGGLGTGGSGASTAPPSVGLGSTEAVTTYTDMLGNTHSSAADRDRANLGIQQRMYGSGNQAARNVQQELYRQYAERFPEGKRMEGDSEKLGRIAADEYLKFAPQINELLGPQGLPNQPFNLPFSFSGIENIKPRGSEDSPDQSSQVDVDQSGVGLPSGLILPSEQDIGLGPGGTGNQFDLPTGGPGTFGSTGLPPARTYDTAVPPGSGTTTSSPAPDFVTGTSGGGSSKDPNQFPVEQIQSIFSPKDDKDKDNDKDDKSDPRLKLIPKGEDGKPVVDLEVLKNTGLLEIYLENLANPDERLNRTPQVPGAAQTQLLTNAFNTLTKDPNFFEQTVNKIIKNLTLTAFDPEAKNREQAQAILDAYEDTGTFAYDSEKDALDLSDTPEGLANFEKLQEMSAGDGQEIGTIGVYDEKGNVVGDGKTYKNTKDGVVVETIFDKLSSGDDDDDDDDDTTVDTGHTVDENGNKVCNTEGYVYNPETKICEPKKVDDDDKDLTINVVRGEDFDDVLSRVTTAAPNIGSIAGNVQNMQEGGMAGLNRAADNFLQALAG